jgi:hypothetical protein
MRNKFLFNVCYLARDRIAILTDKGINDDQSDPLILCQRDMLRSAAIKMIAKVSMCGLELRSPAEEMIYTIIDR